MAWITFNLTLIAYYGLHSAMASLNMKRLFANIGIGDQIYRILFNIVAILSSIGIIYGYTVTTTEFDQDGSILGFGVIAFGVIIVFISLINYDLLVFIGLRKEKQYDYLIVTSLNQYLRHPLYLGILIALLGLLILKPSGASFSVLTISFLYVLFGIHLEEKKLIDQFGNRYLEYIDQVPKLIPKFPT